MLVLVVVMPLVVQAQPIVVAVEVAVDKPTEATVAQVELLCDGSQRTQQGYLSASQERQRTAQTVLTHGIRGQQQELWWWRNGSFRKS
jgi:hypothetical protein